MIPSILLAQQPEPREINQADHASLVAVRGIGSVYASRILDFLSTNKDIQKMESLLDIKGIGPAKLRQLRCQFYAKAEGIRPCVPGPKRKKRGAASYNGQVLNINLASASELVSLPGIGPKKASLIVEDRKTNGMYRSADEITRVRGIGVKTLEKLRPIITTTADINKAVCKDFLALGFSDCTAIIAYREKHGPFKSALDLGKIDNVDKEHLKKIGDFLMVASEKSNLNTRGNDNE